MRLKDKVAIITGAASGIGLATAEKFVAEGAILAVCDRDATAIERTVKALQGLGAKVAGYAVDVVDHQQVEDMVSDVKVHFGKVDVLINNAGIVMDAQVGKMTEAQFDQVIAVDLKGVYNCAKAVINVMVEQGSGVILNASSVVGIYGNFGQTNYAAAKFGVIGMAKTWAKELGKKGIRANAVCPGFVATPILNSMPEKVIQGMEEKIPMKRLARPEEIANVYAFLASDEASYINGAVLEVTGGLVI